MVFSLRQVTLGITQHRGRGIIYSKVLGGTHDVMPIQAASKVGVLSYRGASEARGRDVYDRTVIPL